MQGKLTSQNLDDGNAKTLYGEISEERKELLKAKKISKVELTDDTISSNDYEIPSTWMWVKLYELSVKDIKRGKAPKYVDKSKTQVFAQKCNLKTGGINMKLAKFLSDEKVAKFNEEDYLYDKDIVINSTGTGTLGRVGIFTDEDRIDDMPVFPDSHITVVRLLDKIDKRFVFYAIKRYQGYLEGNGIGSTNQRELRPEMIMGLQIPLPPYKEQKRIVEKIEAAVLNLSIIDDLQTRYSSDRDVLKGKLIDAAICGKLTKQLPEDSTAEELYKQIQEEKKYLEKEGKIKNSKKLPEITEDEIPFDIPANWKWVRLSDVLDVRDGTHDSPKYHDEGIPLVTSKNISGGSLSFDDVKLISEEDAKKINERSFVDDGDILFAMIGSIGNPVIVKKDRDFCIKNVALFKNISEKDLDMSYVYWFLMHEQYELRKTAIGGLQPFVSLKVFRNHLMPLPPIAEQKRISNRLYELSAAVTEQSL